MSRYEGKITAASDVPLEMAELLAAMGAETTFTPRDRQAAIACYLSAGEGWRDALDVVGGAFAADGQTKGLRSPKEE